MAHSFECIECKHSFSLVDDSKLLLASFFLFVLGIVFLFVFFPISILLFLAIWALNQRRCPRCRSKRLVAKPQNPPEHRVNERVTGKRISGWKLFIGGLGLFLVSSLSLLAWLSAKSGDSTDGYTLSDLPNFTLSVPKQEAGDITFYTYRPDGLDNYSITMATGFSELGRHEGGGFDLERDQKNISGIDVLFGYQEEFLEKGVKIAVAYGKLAFDFEYKGEVYSGEVSNLQYNPSKNQLMGILDDFVRAIAESGSQSDNDPLASP